MDTWHTKEDMLNDLSVLGYKHRDINEEYILCGTAPPPPPLTDINIDDDEITLRFGKCSNTILNSYNNGPDLDGITQMLRSVTNNDDVDRESFSYAPKPNKQSIVISKLNPDVPAFVPKSSKQGNSSPKQDDPCSQTTVNNIKENNVNILKIDNKIEILDGKMAVKSNDSIKETCSKKDETQNININGDITKELNQETKDDIDKKANALKQKIIQSAKNNTIQNKKDRNLAIASLMKLHSRAPDASTLVLGQTQLKSASPQTLENTTFKSSSPVDEHNIPSTSKPILMTPAYFAEPVSSSKIVKIDEEEHNIPECVPLQAPNIKTPSPHQTMSPEVKDSIKKVTNWLKIPSKPEPKLEVKLHLGADMFRRKDSSNSPTVSLKNQSKEEFLRPPSYVPSKNADEIKKRYEERLKAREAEKVQEQENIPSNNVIWTNELEKKLKERDEAIKKQWKEKHNSSNGRSSSSSSRMNGEQE